jgi:hypothetical protein
MTLTMMEIAGKYQILINFSGGGGGPSTIQINSIFVTAPNDNYVLYHQVT